MKIERRFTTEETGAYGSLGFRTTGSEIRNPDGSVVFSLDGIEVPTGWSQVASDVLAQKYFRKAGVPAAIRRVKEKGVPEFLWRGVADEAALALLPEAERFGGETSARQVFDRLAGAWAYWGWKGGYFSSEADARAYYDEMRFMLATQMGAPNSPQWFNTGLHESYGITGKPQGHYYVDPKDGQLKKSTNAYERPQPHACFILSVSDDLVNDGGIMDLWMREARIFKYGSGVGTNFSNIRGEGEKLSGGGTSSGLMSFLKIGDRAAGAIKSGGTTRRAAKMVCLDLDHPEVMNFINWKVEEEDKVAALIAAGYPSDYEGEAYRTVSGQNSNNSVRIPNSFFKVLDQDGDWELKARTDGSTMKKVPARELWNKISYAAWRCADPGTQYDTTINEWHTCPEGGPIRASNPCSEYMFLDNTACNLASVNLRKFFNEDNNIFDVKGFEYFCRLWTVVLEISVLMAQFPSKEVAQLSYDYRTLGLGYANLGSVLMLSGIAYDSEEARGIAGAVTAIMTGIAYKTSAEMASFLGAFDKYEENKQHMLRVMRNHRAAAYDATEAYEGIQIKPQGINAKYCPDYLLKSATKAWDDAVQLGEKYGYRNAQTTVIAPTGTIGRKPARHGEFLRTVRATPTRMECRLLPERPGRSQQCRASRREGRPASRLRWVRPNSRPDRRPHPRPFRDLRSATRRSRADEASAPPNRASRVPCHSTREPVRPTRSDPSRAMPRRIERRSTGAGVRYPWGSTLNPGPRRRSERSPRAARRADTSSCPCPL